MSDVVPGVQIAESDQSLSIKFDDYDRRNPITVDVRLAVMEALSRRRKDTKCVVFSGSGGVFSSGGDLSSMPPDSNWASDVRMRVVGAFIQSVMELPLPTIAAVEGPAAGAAVGLVAGCDFVVASEESSFHLPFSKLGLFPDGGILSTLAQRVGAAQSRRLLICGSKLDSVEAYRLGLVDELVPSGSSLDRALEIAKLMSHRSPNSIQSIKETLLEGVPSLEFVLRSEVWRQRKCFTHPDFSEGRAAFFDRREPVFGPLGSV
ncbi:Enoyl-CoA hydratase/carnithine racemase [Brevibacterium sandarakinum]|uniref:Enoyl-CoA hydratase/carnithine racemase n=1 Tax=Brevibacterium sandarakinum TaxID=629680 RepID=A0A1H1SBB3_BRESA|nr:enoyl-CoA hydratase-related protein [Brevibacterium sandarakinum]SDS45088.1 Enoyl-CoA hydratase/carnithine racemase [Brevibacterium sandarakinum]